MAKCRLLFLVLVVLACEPARGENWPRWRGAGGSGISAEKDLPTTWGASENVTWQVDLPLRSHSSPIVWDDQVLITGAVQGGKQRVLLCLNRADATELWKQEVVYEGDEPSHEQNGYATATPVTDGQCVVAYFGSAGARCYDLAGKPLWSRDFGEFHHMWGSAASPIIEGDTVYLYCGPAFKDVLVAVDKATGQSRWEKAAVNAGWSSPLVIETGGRRELILCAAGRVKAFDPSSGELLWYVRGQKSIAVASPLWANGLVYTQTGDKNVLLAIRPGGKQNVTDTHVAWRSEGAPHIGSAIVYGDYLFMVTENGVASCINAITGARLAQRRLDGNFRGSPVAGDGKLYVVNREGDTYVINADSSLKVLAVNSMPGDDFQTTPAISDGQIFIRAENRLYCIGQRRAGK